MVLTELCSSYELMRVLYGISSQQRWTTIVVNIGRVNRTILSTIPSLYHFFLHNVLLDKSVSLVQDPQVQ